MTSDHASAVPVPLPGADGVAGRMERLTRSDSAVLSASSLTVASRLGAKLALLLFLIALPRLLTLGEFAAYSYLLALAVTFSLLGETGVALAAGREVSSGRFTPAQALRASLPVVTVGGLAAAVLLSAFVALDSGPGAGLAAAAAAALFVVANTYFNLAATLLRSTGRVGLEAAVQSLGMAAFVATGIVLALAGFGVAAILAALALKEAVSAAIAHRALRADIDLRRCGPTGRWRTLLRIGVHLALASTAFAVITRAPLVLLGNLAPAAQVAWFSAPLRLADAALVVAATAGFALLPTLTHLLASDRPRATRLMSRLLWIGGAGGLALGALGVLFAEDIVRVVFGAAFTPAAACARILLAGLPAYVLLGLAWYFLTACDGERDLARVAAAGCVASLLLSAVLIPVGADVGAAAAYVASVALLALGYVAMLARRLGRA